MDAVIRIVDPLSSTFVKWLVKPGADGPYLNKGPHKADLREREREREREHRILVNPMVEGFTVPKSLGRFGISQLVGTPGEEDEEVEEQRESTHFMISVKLAKEA